MLSGYRLMWMMVLFDLPVKTADERKKATEFRQFLLDCGFEMAQLSVYVRFCSGKDQSDTFVKQIRPAIPVRGKVHILFFTDKQYEMSLMFNGKKKKESPKKPEQLVLL
ncbi:MAG: CRISPR-associated endonuclease Cas2 [Myxococcales bacterium]|nr:CRISPR-associated endonuclease Cas2 [Myxococcales bacterium]